MDIFAAVFWARRRRWIGILVAFVGPTLAILLRFALGGALVGFPFITFFPGILVAALLGGVAIGALSAFISVLFAVYFLIAPEQGLLLAWPSGYVAIATFAFIAAVSIVLVNETTKASAKLAEASDLLKAANDRLEIRVAERTSELTLLTAQLREEIRTKELAETQVRQMQKIEAVGQLTGGIAHDFNNMLAIIMGSLEMADRRLAQGRPDIQKYLGNAMEGAKRAAGLTHQLLAFSRQQPLAPAVADVNAIVANMADILHRALGETVNLECVLAGGAWRTKVDAGQLENAILNLAVNARDAMPEGGKLTIETQNAWLDDAYARGEPDVAPGQYVLIAVIDTGAGMPPEVISRAFDPFFTTKPTGRGTGLGLAQVYGFIKQSDGHVKIYSETGHGTTVKIYLPRLSGAAAAAGPQAAPVTAAPPVGNPAETVLLVEDDDAVRLVHVNMLRGLNYTVHHAAGGAQALEMLAALPGISLLFTDVVMPGMSGHALAEAAKKLNAGLKVLYTTGYTANAVVHNGVIDADVDLLQKPFAYDLLARKIRAVLDRPG